jgi:hypothetical protein
MLPHGDILDRLVLPGPGDNDMPDMFKLETDKLRAPMPLLNEGRVNGEVTESSIELMMPRERETRRGGLEAEPRGGGESIMRDRLFSALSGETPYDSASLASAARRALERMQQ